MKKKLMVLMAVIVSFTISSCGKSGEVKNLEKAILEMNEEKLSSSNDIYEIQTKYNELSESEKLEVENYEEFENKIEAYDNMLKGFSDETKFCARSLFSIDKTFNTVGYDIEHIGFVIVDDIKYSIVIYNNEEDNKKNLYIATDEEIMVIGKTLGEYDPYTGFTVFENPEDVDDDFIDNYDKDNNVDIGETIALALRYLSTFDETFIDISGFEDLYILEESKKNSKNDFFLAQLELVNIEFALSSIMEKYVEYYNSEEPYDDERLDFLYDSIMSSCEVISERNISGMSEEAEKAKLEVVKSVTYMTYEVMKKVECEKNQDTENANIHDENSRKYLDEFNENIDILSELVYLALAENK